MLPRCPLVLLHHAYTSEQLHRHISSASEDVPRQRLRDLGDPIWLDQAEVHNAIKKTAEFLIKNMFACQGCQDDEHHRALQQQGEKMWTQELDNPILDLDELVSSFGSNIPFLKAFIQPGKWIDPANPAVPDKDQLEGICCGDFCEYPENNEVKCPVSLTLLGSEPPEYDEDSSLKLLVQFDIDSILALPSSLAIAAQGMSICLHPSFMQNICSDLHIKLPLPSSVS